MKNVMKEIPLNRLPKQQLLIKFHELAEIAGRAYSDSRAERRACENFQAVRREAIKRGLAIGSDDDELLAETARLSKAATLAYNDAREADRARRNFDAYRAEVSRRGLICALAC